MSGKRLRDRCDERARWVIVSGDEVGFAAHPSLNALSIRKYPSGTCDTEATMSAVHPARVFADSQALPQILDEFVPLLRGWR